MRILIASDKFKGSLTAPEACAAIEEGIRSTAGGGISIECLPVADGGDGIALTLTAACSGRWRTCQVRDALGAPTEAGYGLIDDDKVAVIEMAEASGLAKLGERKKVPWSASTFGTGELILDAVAAGVKKVILGIGGSATNDGGTGMASALGWSFLNLEEEKLTIPEGLSSVAVIKDPGHDLPEILVACDVDNPLLGPDGCTRVYGPQKGIEPKDFERQEDRLAHLVRLFGREGEAASLEPGAGAAGGLGFGARIFLGASLSPGFDLVAEQLDLESRIEGADLVITGEGKLDAQTDNGKAPAGVLSLCRKHQKPVHAFCGICEDGAGDVFDQVIEISDPHLDPAENMKRGRNHLVAHAAEWARSFLE